MSSRRTCSSRRTESSRSETSAWPGSPTREYLSKVVYRISLAGAIFLGIVAVAPIIVAKPFSGSIVGSFSLGGTALLIVVSVVVETMKQLEAQMLMRHYEGFLG